MKKTYFSLVMVILLTLTSCTSPSDIGTDQPLTAEQAATLFAATMQASPTNPLVTSTPEPPAELLPHTLYYLGNDGIYRRDEISFFLQVYRMDRDGKTITRLTDEPNGVDEYDVSPSDGAVVYTAENQLILISADGSNRRVLVDGGTARMEYNPYSYKDSVAHPVFSPDGQSITYSRNGLTFYDLSTGVSTLAIADQRGGPVFETYAPVGYSHDGTKLLLMIGQWENPFVFAVYDPETGTIVRPSTGEGDLWRPGPIWSADGSSYYGATQVGHPYRTGEIWQMDAATGEVTTLIPFDPESETMSLPIAPFLAPDSALYYFFGEYRVGQGYYDAPVIRLVRSSPDGVTGRTVLREENFVLMSEALWAPDASFVIVATAPSRYLWDSEIGVLELYYTDGQKSPVWLAPVGKYMKWGP